MFGRKKLTNKSVPVAFYIGKKIVAPLLEEKLNEMSKPFPCYTYEGNGSYILDSTKSAYTVTAEEGGSKKEYFLKFSIERNYIDGHSPFNASFVLFTTADDSSFIEQIFQIREYESDKLEAAEYKGLIRVLVDLFDGFKIERRDPMTDRKEISFVGSGRMQLEIRT